MNASQSACLVLHGKAAMREDVRAAVRAVRDEGYHVEVRVTWEGGDAGRFARQAAEAGFGVVVAGGGDGTVNEVVGGLVEGAEASQPPPGLGFLPLGTANDLARACGIPLHPTAALRLAVCGPSAAVDVGQANGRCFLNVATGGFGAQVTVATPNDLKRILGSVAYLLTGLAHFSSIRPARGRLSGPGFAWEGAFLLLAVGNGRQAGGGYQLCPEALLHDGLFDVRLLPQLPGEEIPDALSALLREGLDALQRTLVNARVPRLEIEAEEPLQLNLDGEPMTNTRFRFEVLPRRLPMKLPPGCPLLAGPRAQETASPERTRTILAAGALLAVGALFGWLAASGRLVFLRPQSGSGFSPGNSPGWHKSAGAGEIGPPFLSRTKEEVMQPIVRTHPVILLLALFLTTTVGHTRLPGQGNREALARPDRPGQEERREGRLPVSGMIGSGQRRSDH
jgi:lipid kinase YegS